MATTTIPPQVTAPHGRTLLRDPRYNRGTAFTHEERSALGLEGLLPAAVQTLEQQSNRAYEQYVDQPSDLARNEFLAALHDRNESTLAHRSVVVCTAPQLSGRRQQ